MIRTIASFVLLVVLAAPAQAGDLFGGVYKHAVSTIQPLSPVDLTGDWEGEAEPED